MKVTCIALLLAAASMASAQSYPSKPVRIVVPLAPGGSADVDARLVADRLSQALGQQFIVEHRPGAGGAIGVGMVAKAPPDGYTIGVGPQGTMVIAPGLMKLPFDPLKDLAPLSGMVRSTFLFLTHPNGPFKTVQELIAYAKSNPVSFGTPNIGSGQHLAGELFNSLTGVRMVHVPYKGSGPAAIDVMGGQIPLAIVGPAGISGLIKAGKLKVIALSDSQPVAAFPEVPSVAKAGVAGFDATGWLALFGPAALPKDIVARLNAEIVRALNTAEVRDKIVAGGEDPHPTTPEDLRRFVVAETEKWGSVIRNAGLKLAE